MPRRTYQAWVSDGSVEFSTAEAMRAERERGRLGPDARLLHEFDAGTWEEAMLAHYEKMGWPPYRPHGPPTPCPNACGADYFAQGSSECPNCGLVGGA